MTLQEAQTALAKAKQSQKRFFLDMITQDRDESMPKAAWLDYRNRRWKMVCELVQEAERNVLEYIA
jgi:hypothetical protein